MTNELPPCGAVEAEEARITEAYARRAEGLRYSYFSPGHLTMHQELERRVVGVLRPHLGPGLLQDKQVLEVGCGKGAWLRELIKWGARPENLRGVDILEDHVAEARRLCPQGVRLEHTSATQLRAKDASFDLVMQMVVFTSVKDAGVKAQLAREMLRVVKPDGLILWLDFHMNNPRNPDVQGVKKPEIRQLFPGCEIDLRRVLLAPPLLRALAPYSSLLCQLLGKFPPLCTHYLGTIRKK
jgi:SAM-dependent methyltransferase